MPRFLLTGTDTGIGKTTVASAIAAALRRRRYDVGVLKPVETGCAVGGDGELVAADAIQLHYFAGGTEPLASICPYRFLQPLAPSIAARREGRILDLADVKSVVDRCVAAHHVALIEGAGGLLVPLDGFKTFADLARASALPVLVVVGNRLGALNHAQLTVRYAESVGLAVAGYIVNALQPETDLAAQTNIKALAELLGPPLGVFPWVGPVACTPEDRDRLADAAERSIRLDALLTA